MSWWRYRLGSVPSDDRTEAVAERLEKVADQLADALLMLEARLRIEEGGR